MVLDIDASLIEVPSENKVDAVPTFKGGFGFHPMFCFADATGQALTGKLSAGNAGANTDEDHLDVLDQAISQLPVDIAAGHRIGDESDMVNRQIQVRADSAGYTHGFLEGCVERNISFKVSARKNPQVTEAIFDAEGISVLWQPALNLDGSRDEDTLVAELTSLIDDPKLPEGTRLVVRREPLHPGAQRSLFPSMDYRYYGFYTYLNGDVIEVDLLMRNYAHVEQHIGRLKDSRLERFPFTDLEANAAWMQAVMLAADLVRWFQQLCLPHQWRDVRSKTLRRRIFTAPGCPIRTGRQRIVRVINSWPTTDVIIRANQRIDQLA